MAERPTTVQLLAELVATPRACEEQPELFFEPDTPESDAARVLRERSAAALCEDCPVRLRCLAYAVRTSAEYGIWGGCTAAEVAALADDYAAGGGDEWFETDSRDYRAA